jgi:DNA-binding CsgD family transcriptional regulator
MLDSLLKTGCVNESAKKLGMRREALGMQLVRACRKTGAKNRTLLLLKWAEFRRAHD